MEQLMEQKQVEQRAKWTRLLVWSTLGSTIGAAVPCGYCMGVINSPAAHMRAWCVDTLASKYNFQLTPTVLDTLWALIVSIYLIGGVLGSACAGWATNRLGRRGCFLLSGLLLLLAALGFVSCRWLQSVELLLLSRLVVGLGGGLVTTGLPIYHSELAALNQRGTLAVGCAVGFSIGILLAQLMTLQTLLGSSELWHYALSFYVFFMAPCYAPFVCYAESPKWLFIVKQRRQSALQLLQRLRGSQFDLQQELRSMELEASSKSNARSLWQVLKDERMLLPLVLLCAYQGGQQLTGCSSIFYYSVFIFSASGISTRTAEWLNIAAGAVNLFTSLLNPLLMSKFNRRTLMLSSSAGASLFMFSFAWFVAYSHLHPWLSLGTIASMFLFLITFQLALGAMPSFIGAELFEVPSRSAALALGNQVGWGCNFLVGFLFPVLHSLLGYWIFLLFSCFSALLFLLTRYYLPETRGREVSQVAALVSQGFRSKVI